MTLREALAFLGDTAEQVASTIAACGLVPGRQGVTDYLAVRTGGEVTVYTDTALLREIDDAFVLWEVYAPLPAPVAAVVAQ